MTDIVIGVEVPTPAFGIGVRVLLHVVALGIEVVAVALREAVARTQILHVRQVEVRAVALAAGVLVHLAV